MSMTKEQEEAIENLKGMLEYKRQVYNMDTMRTEIVPALYDIDRKAIETVLSMLKQNSAEIEQKNTELAEKNAEIEKLDKIIYEMIGSFIDLGFGWDYCNNDDKCINDCGKCIEQYFERKATNNG